MTDGALSVRAVVALFLEHARVYYRRRDGSRTREDLNLRSSLAWLLRTGLNTEGHGEPRGRAGEQERRGGGERSPSHRLTPTTVSPSHLVGDLPIAQLNRTHVKLMRLAMIAADLTRSYINKVVSHVRRFLEWAADDDVGLCPREVLADVKSLKCLPVGRSAARETSPRTAVAPERVAKTLPHLAHTPRVIIQLLALTSSRLGQFVRLTTGEINRDDPATWWAVPKFHKGTHRGKRLSIPLDARCQKLLGPYLKPFAPDDPLFPSPRDPKRPYRRDSIAKAITRACQAAGVEAWSPHQIRHLAAGQVRRALGLDAAQALLGHADVKTTQIYAPVGSKEAEEAQRALPGVAMEVETDQMRFWG